MSAGIIISLAAVGLYAYRYRDDTETETDTDANDEFICYAARPDFTEGSDVGNGALSVADTGSMGCTED